MANPLLDKLQQIGPLAGGNGPKILRLFGDQPEVLEAILEARKRRCSFAQIAKALTTPENVVSENAVKTFLTSRGVD
jgi:hypothetical protein